MVYPSPVGGAVPRGPDARGVVVALLGPCWRRRRPTGWRWGRDRAAQTSTSATTSRWSWTASGSTLEEGELVVVVRSHRRGKSTLLGVLTGLVPRFTGGTLPGDVTHRRASSRPAAARARPRRRLRRPGPGSRFRHRHGRGGARLRDRAARACRATRCAGGSRRRSTCSGSPTCGPATCATLSGGQQQRVAHRRRAHDSPAAAGAGRADLGPRPDRRRGRARRP